MKRREFIKSGALGGLAPGLALAPATARSGPAYNEEILVYIFLRGGIDGLNLVVPLDPADHGYYSTMRPTLAIPDSGPGAALPIGGEPFGFNPRAAPLNDLYAAGHLAIVNAVGTPDAIASRSHFDAEKYVELGTPGLVGTLSGWLHRHFLSMGQTLNLYPEEILLPVVALRNTPPASLLGNTSSLTVWSPDEFRLDNAHWRWNYQEPEWVGEKGYMQMEMLPELYGLSAGEVPLAGSQALAAEAILRASFDSDYSSSGSLPYEQNNIARQLADVAQLIKLEVGTRLFSLDFGNFDSHANQDDPGNYDNLVEYLSRALAAFMDDLAQSGGDYASRTTVIVQSEFGRRAYQNVSNGTDHGNGNLMLVLGAAVNGGQMYGEWPGLYPGTEDGWVEHPNPKNGSEEPELFQGALATTTDFRRVLSEYLHQRCEHTEATRQFVFPGYSGYSPLGIFQPLNQRPNHIFGSDFES